MPRPLYLLIPLLLFVLAVSLSAKEVRKMNLTSPAFADGQPIPALYTCDGKDASPPLAIQGVPSGTKSLALVVDDPDAPVGTWVHWVVWNIAPGTIEIPAGHAPAEARQGTNSWKKTNYGAPCPPSGTHRYFFKLYALKDTLTLPSSAQKKDLEHAMQGKILAQCELMGTYSKK
ncbi:hypothetical protein GMSM_41440 [Geomonas sp. Red276]